MATVGQRVNSWDGEINPLSVTMTRRTRSSDPERLSEWASLTGERLPEEYGPCGPETED